MDGLTLDLGAFKKLPVKAQNAILYQNTEELKAMVGGYKFHQKVQYIWLGVLTVSMGFGKYMGWI